MIGIKTKFVIGVALIAMAAPAMAQRGRAAAPATITLGQTIEGTLAAAATSTTCTADGPELRSYRFQGQAGQRIQITQTADDFDSMIEIGKMDGCNFVTLGSNDDGAGPEDGLNSRLVARLPETGTYVIRARSLGDTGVGKFNLTLTALPALAEPAAPIALTLGQKVEGELTANDPVIEEAAEPIWSGEEGMDAESTPSIIESARPYRLYSLAGTAGQEILLSLDSDEFDAFIEAGADSPLGFVSAASNDDGGGEEDGLNSRLRVTFKKAGTILIRVSPLSSDTGHYSLTAAIAPPVDANSEVHEEGH
jgi:hypothetical protein